MNTVEIIFSPTGGTETVAGIIGSRWSDHTKKIDLSDSKTDFSGCVIGREDRVLIAMPSFGGRAPAAAIGAPSLPIPKHRCIWKSAVERACPPRGWPTKTRISTM